MDSELQALGTGIFIVVAMGCIFKSVEICQRHTIGKM